jgi:hypothetical protein
VTAVDCNDNNLCTTDVCTSSICMNQQKVCPISGPCNPTTGNCEEHSSCNAASDCTSRSGFKAVCNSKICTYVPFTQCKAYQSLSNGDCKFSFSNLFTGSGLKAYYADNTLVVWGIGIIILLFIVMIIFMTNQKKDYVL